MREDQLPALAEGGWSAHFAPTPADTRKALRRQSYPVILVRFGRQRQLDLPSLKASLDMAPHARWIAVLSPGLLEDPHLRDLVYEHFYDYHTLPVGPARLLSTLGHAYGMTALRPAPGIAEEHGADDRIVGDSRPIEAMRKAIDKVSRTQMPLLITGEIGTGKTLSARELHRLSDRRHGPFIAINCAALPAESIRSILFGHERGAFTGARSRHIGCVEAAHNGTVLLQEVGDLPSEIQAKLLRVVEEGSIDRVGASQSIPVDVRVIASTREDLGQSIARGAFRQDLYYRLNVLNLQIPPLRDRANDVELLARFCFQRFNDHKSRHVEGFSQQAIAAMRAHDWPGNVQELINRVRQAMILGEHRLLRANDLGLPQNHEDKAHILISLDEARDRAEHHAIVGTLHHSGFNVSRAARHLGVSRITLYRLMKKHQISSDPPDTK